MPAENRGAFPKIQQRSPSDGSGPGCLCLQVNVFVLAIAGLFYFIDM
jgi:hypothetical protein